MSLHALFRVFSRLTAYSIKASIFEFFKLILRLISLYLLRIWLILVIDDLSIFQQTNVDVITMSVVRVLSFRTALLILVKLIILVFKNQTIIPFKLY